MNKVLHLTIGHSPFDDRIFYKECSVLEPKYSVLILAYSSDGSISDMSGVAKSPNIYNGISVDSFHLQSANQYMRYFRERFFKYTAVLIDKLAQHEFTPDVIHCHEPNSLIQGVTLKEYFNCKLIFDAHEFFLGYIFDAYNNFIRRHVRFGRELRRMQKLFQHVDATISVNDIIRSYNVVLNPYITHALVSNGYIFQDTDQALSNINGKIVLVHEGSLKFNRGFKFMINCFDDNWFRENVILKIVGELRNQEKLYFESQVRIKPWLLENIVQTGWLDYLDVPKHLSGSIGLILMEPTVNNLLAGPPNKLFNYISASLPVISFDIPASAGMIKRHDVGLIVARNRESFKRGIETIIADYQLYKTNIEQTRRYFSFSSEADKLYAVYDQLLWGYPR